LKNFRLQILRNKKIGRDEKGMKIDEGKKHCLG
jgi:hypothetical protein